MRKQLRFSTFAFVIVLPILNYFLFNFLSSVVESSDKDIGAGVVAIFLFANLVAIGIIGAFSEIFKSRSITSFLFPITIEKAKELGLKWEENNHPSNRSIWSDRNGRLYLIKNLCFDIEPNVRCRICGGHIKYHTSGGHLPVWGEQNSWGYNSYSHLNYKK